MVDLFAVLRDQDVLVHHPYDSFATSVEAFIAQAADDPDVLAIKQTLYRTSGDSPIVASLIQASRGGQAGGGGGGAPGPLRRAGQHRVGPSPRGGWRARRCTASPGLKTHSKTALVARREEDGIRRYCHIGTGNYNPRTALNYEDLGLLSSNPDSASMSATCSTSSPGTAATPATATWWWRRCHCDQLTGMDRARGARRT